MNTDSFDPDKLLRELERLAISAARTAKAKIDEVFVAEGYYERTIAEQKAFMHGARVGGSAMLDAVTMIVPKITGLTPNDIPPDEAQGKSNPNPFSL